MGNFIFFNMFSSLDDYAFGPTEEKAKLSLISTIKARHQKVTRVETLDEYDLPTDVGTATKLYVHPYGLYQIEITRVSSEFKAFMSVIRWEGVWIC
jgi:hypothetical protein